MKSSKNDEMLTFGGHLEVLRRMLFRIIAVAAAIAMGSSTSAAAKPSPYWKPNSFRNPPRFA